MTPQQLTQRLHAVCGANLTSVILYGSAVTGDHVGKRSNFNVLVVLERLGVDELQALAPLVRSWVKAGHPAPLLLTATGLVRSADVFPLEIADIKAGHEVLFGEDVVRDLPVHDANLRVQLEHELRGKLLQLRQRYVLAQGRPKQVTELMVQSLSTFLVLCRGALRLYQPDVPVKKMEALAVLATHVPVPTGVFETIGQLKAGRRVPGVVPETLFVQYLQAIETVIEAVDARLHARA